MDKRNILIHKSGIVNVGWKDFAVYFIGVPSKGDIYYIGKSKNLSKRTGYTECVENYKCINQNSGRFPLVLWNNRTVLDFLNTTSRSDLSERTNFLDLVEAGGIFLFKTYLPEKGNRTRKSLPPEDVYLGAAIIIFTRKYNIIESIKKSLLIYKDLFDFCKSVRFLSSDTEKIKDIKKDYLSIQKDFFNNINLGKFIVQQGLERDIYSSGESGILYSSEHLEIYFGEYCEMFDMIKKGNKYISDSNGIYILNDSKKYIVFLVKPNNNLLDKYIDITKIEEYLGTSLIKDYIDTDLINLINKQLNFIPVE